MKIAIIDKVGLCYDGDTLSKQGLGGSESAVILMAKNLQDIGFEVTVFNNCKDGSHSKPGVFGGVRYIDNADAKTHNETYDIVTVSRTVVPFVTNDWPFVHTAKKRILWLHDTFIDGDELMEDLAVAGKIDHVFTLSDWHTSYILTCAHGKKRNYEVLKKKIFQTRNGAVCHIPEVDLSKKDPNHFVYNSSATKGMLPLVEHIWPEIKKGLPQARLTIIGGYYRMREGAAPDVQENTVEQLSRSQELKDLGVTFTGVIPQHKIAEILANAWMMLYPGAFPETFGISSLESLLYKTPLMTTRFGALEETAVDLACYHIDYAIEPNNLFPHINKELQVQRFLQAFFSAYSTPYLHQQKQNYCEVVKDVAGWDTVALQWKQFFYSIMGEFLPVDEYRKVTRINDKVARVFGRTGNMPATKEYRSFGREKPITIISPFWNAANYIEKNIRSVAAQDYDNYFHILIDDASDDDSYRIAKRTIESLPDHIQENFRLIRNDDNKGCIRNQLEMIQTFGDPGDIIMLLDGDDWLVNNNTIFQYYNDLYSQGYEFTYGSMWSIVDNIPLIAQEYPAEVKKSKTYRSHMFNWKIPYTHLRTCLGMHFNGLSDAPFTVNGEWMKSGADNPLFYELIERVDPDKIYCNREIVCNYNDANPLNDYKIRGDEQNRNASMSYGTKRVPTNAYILRTSHPTSQEYAKNAADSCDKIGLSWEYFDGVEGKTTAEVFSGLKVNGDMNDIAACATASHFAIWKKILDNKETAIVLEHDSLMLQPVSIDIPDNKIVALGYKFKDVDFYDHETAGPPKRIVDVPRHSGAHAYALTWKTCESLLSEIATNGVTRAIDNFYFMRINQSGDTESSVPLAIADPTPAICWIRKSTIWEDPSTLNYELLPSFIQNSKSSNNNTGPNDMFSVIIPTMWRALDVFERALTNYINHDLVDEIIIIDNDRQANPNWSMLRHPKVKLYTMEKNIYVNPAWNLGVSLSKNDKLIIANDDIEFDIALLDKMHPRVIPENGVHGIIAGESRFLQPEPTDYSIDFKEWEPGDIIHGFGQLMFLHKINWTELPAGMNIYYGDDIIFQYHLHRGLKNYMIHNIKFYSPMAATTKDGSITIGASELDPVFYNEWADKHPVDFSMELANEYRYAKVTPTDINEHVETLKKLCDEVESVTEFGVRTGVSTRGVLISKAKKVRSYDLYLYPRVEELFKIASKYKDAIYQAGDSRTIEIEQTDLLFIDTDHNYQQLKDELNRHHTKVNKYICFHDTHTFGVHSDNDTDQLGLIPAIMEFMRDHPEWKVDYFTTKNNGFTVLKKDAPQPVVAETKIEIVGPKKKILVAIPTSKYIEVETFKSLWDVDVPDGYELDFQYFYGYTISQIRNLIADWAKHYDYLFSVDSDIVVPKDALVKMIAADKDIISGLYIQRIPNTHTLEVYMDTPNGGCTNIPYDLIQNRGIVEIAACGMGCALIKGEVFRRMEYPHFFYKEALTMQDTVSEDVYFCMKARKSGFSVWTDTSIQCDHKGTNFFRVQSAIVEKTHLQKMAEGDGMSVEHSAYLKTMGISPKVIYDIGACVMHWTRKAREVWSDATYYLLDAAHTVQPYIKNEKHAIAVLSDVDGKFVDFYEDPNNPFGNSYYRETTGAFKEDHKSKRMTMKLDTIAKQNGWLKPDLIKIDVQGAEIDVLKGAAETLSQCKDIILEAQHEDYNEGAPKFEEVKSYLESIGFTLKAEIVRTKVDGDYHFTRK